MVVDKLIYKGEKYILISDYSVIYQRSEKTIRQAIEKGKLKSVKINNRRYIKI